MAKENKPTEQSQFLKALNFEIPKDKIEVITDRSGGKPLSYVSWAYAWGMFKQLYPDAKYRILKNENELPYFVDPNLGIMCYTEITAGGETHQMWLLVMDSSNKAMRLAPYTYQKWNSRKGWEEKGVAAATMFDINKTLMRCLVKNMAMFGFGLNIYNGDDLPEFDLETEEDDTKQQPKAVKQKKSQTAQATAPAPIVKQATQITLEIFQNDPYANIKQILLSLNTIDQMMEAYRNNKDYVEGNPEIKSLFGLRRRQIENKTA